MLIWLKTEITIKIGHFVALEQKYKYLDKLYEFRDY